MAAASSILLGLLTPHERAGFDAIAKNCGDRFRPLPAAGVSRTTARALAKLGLVDTVRGRVDRALLIRLSTLGRKTNQEPTTEVTDGRTAG